MPYLGNPRKNDHCIEKMAEVIKEYGFIIPVVVKANGEVVDGHLRLKTARFLGWKEVPVVIADHLSDKQAKAFRVAANKTATWAENDEAQLKRELKALKDFDFDLTLTGFSEMELEPLVDFDIKPLTGRLGKFGVTDEQGSNDSMPQPGDESGFAQPAAKVAMTFVLDRDSAEYAAWVKFKDANKKKDDGAAFCALLRTLGDA
jgi:Predicted transcriptional regulators